MHGNGTPHLTGAALAVLAALAGSLAGAEEPATNAPGATEVQLTPDTVLTRRGPAEITVQEFQARLAGVPEQHRQAFANDPERIGQLLEQLARNELLAIKAREAGLEKDGEVRMRIELAAREVLAQEMLAHVAEAADPPDFEQQAREYYLTHKDEFRLPERVDASHVLIGTDRRGDAEAKELADRVAKLAREGEVPFEDLVSEYSDDPSAFRNGGLFRNVQRGQMVKPFEEAAFGLEEPGEIAGPVKSEYGYHVIRLEARKPSEQQPFEKVRKRLVAKMQDKYRARVRQEYIAQLLNENELEAEPAVIRALRERYRPESNPDSENR